MLIARSAFANLSIELPPDGGVMVRDRDGLGIATAHARKGKAAALAVRIRESFGLELPHGPRRTVAGDVAFAGTGPGAWLATCENGSNAFSARLKEATSGLASVSDQSDGYAVLRLSGPKVRATLAKIIPIDLHPIAFKPGDVASTVASHVGVTLWRLEDGPDGSPCFEVATLRSLAGSFGHLGLLA